MVWRGWNCTGAVGFAQTNQGRGRVQRELPGPLISLQRLTCPRQECPRLTISRLLLGLVIALAGGRTGSGPASQKLTSNLTTAQSKGNSSCYCGCAQGESEPQ